MIEYVMAAKNGRTVPKEDKIFGISNRANAMIEEKGNEKWFLARKAQLDMLYWERYKKYLLADKGFSSIST